MAVILGAWEEDGGERGPLATAVMKEKCRSGLRMLYALLLTFCPALPPTHSLLVRCAGEDFLFVFMDTSVSNFISTLRSSSF